MEVIEKSAESSRTTHGAATCVDACRYFGNLIAGAVNGVSKDVLLSERSCPISGYWPANPLIAEIDEIAAGSFSRSHFNCRFWRSALLSIAFLRNK